MFTASARSGPKRSHLEHKILPFGPVDYRGLDVIPAADWALPEKVALMKPVGWDWQREFRILAGKKGTFAVHNVRMTLQNGPQPPAPIADHVPLLLKLGDLSRGARLHRF